MYWSSILSRFDSAVAPESPADREAFAFRLLSLLAVTAPPGPEFDADSYALVLVDGTRVHLDGLHAQLRDLSAAERESAILRIAGRLAAGSSATVSEDRAEALARLIPRLMPAAHYPLWSLREAVEGRSAVVRFTARHVTDSLTEQLAYELPETFALIGNHQLEGWGISRERAFRAAMSRLRASEWAPFTRLGTGTWTAAVGDDLDAARLLMIEQIEALGVHGDIVALPANRDTLVITGSEDRAGLARLLAVATEAARMPELITTRPVTWRHGRWQDWTPVERDPLREAFAELDIRLRATWYEAQKELIARLVAQSGRPRSVAPFDIVRHPRTGRVHSHTRLDGRPSYFPEVDLVSVPVGDAEVMVTWDDLMGVARPALRRSGFFAPPMWEADGPLPAGVREALRGRALE